MKTYLFIVLVCSPWLTCYAQLPCVQTHKGEVVLRAIYGQKANGIGISIDGNTGLPTDQNGVFQFKLTKCPGMSIRMKVNNYNYGIINHVEMSFYTLRKLAHPNDFQFSVIVSLNNQKEQQFYIDKYLFKAVIYRNLFDLKSTEYWYREAAITDTTEFDNLFFLARFLQNQNKPVEPEYWYNKSLFKKGVRS